MFAFFDVNFLGPKPLPSGGGTSQIMRADQCCCRWVTKNSDLVFQLKPWLCRLRLSEASWGCLTKLSFVSLLILEDA